MMNAKEFWQAAYLAALPACITAHEMNQELRLKYKVESNRGVPSKLASIQAASAVEHAKEAGVFND